MKSKDSVFFFLEVSRGRCGRRSIRLSLETFRMTNNPRRKLLRSPHHAVGQRLVLSSSPRCDPRTVKWTQERRTVASRTRRISLSAAKRKAWRNTRRKVVKAGAAERSSGNGSKVTSRRASFPKPSRTKRYFYARSRLRGGSQARTLTLSCFVSADHGRCSPEHDYPAYQRLCRALPRAHPQELDQAGGG